MRTRPQTLLPSVLALALISLLLIPLAVLAQGPMLRMSPETARPGSTVEITGIGFPADQLVEVELTTPDGTVHLVTAASSIDGGFREIAALPLSATEGEWALRATAVDGTSTTLGFTSSSHVVSAEAAADPAPAVPAGVETRRGNSSGDIALMLIVAVILGGAAFGGMFIYRQLKDETPPGMGRGDDLIWGGGSPDGPEQTATEEPYWKTAQSQPTAPTTRSAQTEG